MHRVDQISCVCQDPDVPAEWDKEVEGSEGRIGQRKEDGNNASRVQNPYTPRESLVC